MWAGAIVENRTDAAFAMKVTFQLLDARGTPLGPAEPNDRVVVRAREQTAVGARLIVPFDATPLMLRVKAHKDEIDPARDSSPGSTMQVKSASFVPDDRGELGLVKGVVVSKYQSRVPSAIVTALCYSRARRDHLAEETQRIGPLEPGVARALRSEAGLHQRPADPVCCVRDPGSPNAPRVLAAGTSALLTSLCHALPMTDADLSAWFGSVNLAGAPRRAELVAAELGRMLDQVRPKLDRHRSVVRVLKHGGRAEAGFNMAHLDGSHADLLLVVDDVEATLYWVAMHDHVTPEDGSDERPWTSVAVDAVAAVLRGEYEVEEVRRRGRLVKSRLIDRADGRVLGVTGGLFAWLLPGRSVTGPRQRLDFGCRG